VGATLPQLLTHIRSKGRLSCAIVFLLINWSLAGLNFTNILKAAFSCKSFMHSFSVLYLSSCFFYDIAKLAHVAGFETLQQLIFGEASLLVMFI